MRWGSQTISGLTSGLGVGVKRLNRCGSIPQIYDISRVRFVALQPLLDGPAVYLNTSEQGNGNGDEEWALKMVRFNHRSAVHHGERGVDDRRLQLDEHVATTKSMTHARLHTVWSTPAGARKAGKAAKPPHSPPLHSLSAGMGMERAPSPGKIGMGAAHSPENAPKSHCVL